MKIHEIFESDITRDIPPVVYFHEQSPDKLAAEVDEYIFTGGWEADHPNHKRVKRGIHEHYVRLLEEIARRLDPASGSNSNNPASWISGFYGSGKSSFAKLLGLALDGAVLPDGRTLAQAWLARDRSQKHKQLVAAWQGLIAKIDPMAVVFDIGGVSRGSEHIHAAVVRQLQVRLGYCSTSALVAGYELKLERDGHYQDFLATAERTLGQPWAALRHTHMAEDHFSAALHAHFPQLYQDPMHWIGVRDGEAPEQLSAEDAALAIADMLRFRAPSQTHPEGKTLFIVVDEVSQYIYQNEQRMLALQSLVSALGQRLRGRAWLLATGQQQLDDQNDANVLNKMRDRFPDALRVHLDTTNIRDVVHRRLLQKRAEALPALRQLYAQHRSNLQLFAYGCEHLGEEDFLEVYPLLPRHIDLILRITSALRTRSSRAQGDHHAIRGLLQMLGELFRNHREALTEAELGALITLDQIYDIQASALDTDTQNTMARIFDFCAGSNDALAIRCAKAVALLELLQDDLGSESGMEPTDSRMVARCLYAHVGEGDNEPEIRQALQRLVSEGLLGYSEKTGFKIQSSAGQDWEREREAISVPSEELGNLVRDALVVLFGDSEQPALAGRKFPWQGLFSTESTHFEDKFVGAREDSPAIVDLRLLPEDARAAETWINRSAESAMENRLLWISGRYQSVLDAARRVGRSTRMVNRHRANVASLPGPRQRLFNEEQGRLQQLQDSFKEVVAGAFMAGTLYFRGSDTKPSDYGGGFQAALIRAGNARLPTIYSQNIASNISTTELEQLLKPDLIGASIKFHGDELGILTVDEGRTVPACIGTVPVRIREQIQREPGLSGQLLLRHFAQPPYGYTAGVVKACVAGLLRGRQVRVRLRDGSEASSIADPGVQDLFRLDRDFKVAEIYPAGEEKIGAKDRAKLVHMFAQVFGAKLEPENEVIADELSRLILPKQDQLRELEARFNRLPGSPPTPEALQKLHKAFEACLRDRQVEPRVLAAIRHRDTLRDGVGQLNTLLAELGDEAIEAVVQAKRVADTQLRQLIEVGELTAALQDAERRLGEQLRSAKPWLGIDAIEPDLEALRRAYRASRRERLAEQERRAELARQELTALEGFATLDPDERHQVLRLVTQALRETGEQEVEPSLRALSEGLPERLAAAVDQGTLRLDELLARKRDQGPTITVDVKIKGRVITSAADVDALLDEIRERLMAQLRGKSSKTRLRLK